MRDKFYEAIVSINTKYDKELAAERCEEIFRKELKKVMTALKKKIFEASLYQFIDELTRIKRKYKL